MCELKIYIKTFSTIDFRISLKLAQKITLVGDSFQEA